MFHIDKGGKSTTLLCLGNHRQGKGGFTRGLRPVDFYNSTTGEPTYSKRAVYQEVACWNNIDINPMTITETHDRCFAKIFLNL